MTNPIHAGAVPNLGQNGSSLEKADTRCPILVADEDGPELQQLAHGGPQSYPASSSSKKYPSQLCAFLILNTCMDWRLHEVA